MNHYEALRQVYVQVAREFHREGYSLVLHEASRKRLLRLYAPYQADLGWSSDEVIDAVLYGCENELLPF